MAYIPGFTHDIFLSYPREDAAWVRELQEQLRERLEHRLGYECDVWQDENRIATGQNWTEELHAAIRQSTAFIAVLSRHYQRSEWCEKELNAFLGESPATAPLEGRLFKVIKLPWRNNSHEGFFPEYQHVEFFSRDTKTGQESELKYTSEAFRKAIDRLSFHIEQRFDAILRGKEKIFVARASADARPERDQVVREIKARGYALSPPPQGSFPRGLDKKVLREYIDEVLVTVHILGAAYDSDVREQISVSAEAEKKMVFWLARGHEGADSRQRELISDVQENRLGLAAGNWALLASRSSQAQLLDLFGFIKPSRPTPSASQATRIYLLCDPTTPEDANFARQVQTGILRQESMQVDLPDVSSGSNSPILQHEKLLNESDGVLLYCENAPPRWYTRNLADLLVAGQRTRTRELKSKALMVSGIDASFPGLTVIQRKDPFDLKQLEPFLAPLRSSPRGELSV